MAKLTAKGTKLIKVELGVQTQLSLFDLNLKAVVIPSCRKAVP